MRFTSVVALFPDLPETELGRGSNAAGSAPKAPNPTGSSRRSTSPASA